MPKKSASSLPRCGDTDAFQAAREQIHRQMLSAVSHDLKTPLATMIGSLEIFTRMEEKLTPEKRRMLIDSALHEAYRLDAFITNILDMAKFEGGMVSPRMAKTNLAHVVDDCIQRLGPQRARGEIQLLNAGGTECETDAILLGRALYLLIDNGLRHAGPNAVLAISYGVEAGRIHIGVRDHGPGIPEDMQEQIFSKYTRMHKADQQNAGTGLGLAICRQIMQVLGGRVGVHNHAEGGAVFTLDIP